MMVQCASEHQHSDADAPWLHHKAAPRLGTFASLVLAWSKSHQGGLMARAPDDRWALTPQWALLVFPYRPRLPPPPPPPASICSRISESSVTSRSKCSMSYPTMLASCWRSPTDDDDAAEGPPKLEGSAGPQA